MCLKDLRDEFIYDCECRHLAKGSLRNYKAAPRFLLEYLEEWDNPAKKVKCLRQPRTIIDTFTAAEMKRMIQFYDGKDFLDVRNKTIIMLLFDTGMRCNEMILMEPEDIKQDYILVKHGNCSCSVSISWAASLYCSTRFSKMLMLMCVPLFKSLVNGQI